MFGNRMLRTFTTEESKEESSEQNEMGSCKFEVFIQHYYANIMTEITEYEKKKKRNCYEHISRWPTGLIPQNLFDNHPEGRKERDRPVKKWKDHLD
jgi:hypothetical protein